MNIRPLNQLFLRLLIWRLFTPALVLLLLTIGFITFLRRHNLEDQQLQLVHSLAFNTDNYLQQASLTLEAVGQIIEGSPPAAIERPLTAVWQTHDFFDTLYYLDDQGLNLLTVPPDANYEGLDASRQPYFQQIEGQDTVTISSPFISGRTGTPTVYLSQQLTDGHVIAAELSLASLQAAIISNVQAQNNVGNVIFMTDSFGTLLTHPQAELVDSQTNFGQLPIIQEAQTSDLTQIYRSYDGWVLGSATHTQNGWIVVSEISLQTAFGPYLATMAASFALISAVWLALVWQLNQHINHDIVAPLAQLNREAQALAADELEQGLLSPSETTFAEINSLKSNFRHMSEMIQLRQTDLEKREQDFQILLNSITDYVWSADVIAGEIIYRYYSPVVERITGYATAYLQQGIMSWLNIIHPDDREMVEKKVQEELSGGIVAREYRIICADGSVKWLYGTTTPTMDASGQVIRLDGVVSDITQRKEAEEALRLAQKMESLGIMAGGIAHDFNNLLGAIISQTSLALTQLPAHNPVRSHIEKSLVASEHAAALTHQLLAYSGRGRFEIQSLDLNQLIQDNLHLLEVALPKQVELCAELASALPPIEADASQIQQVIMNLIINGAEAIGDQPGRVTVSTTVQEITAAYSPKPRPANKPITPGSYVALTVTDSGSGMDEATLAKIFDPFFTTKFTGRGLGLAATQGIVQAHKGNLYVESAVGHGSTFRLLFPASDKPVPPAPEPPLFIPAQPTTGCVLVIDDERAIREAVTDILTFEGIKALTAENGETGIALYQAHHSDIILVILDLSMPGLGGEETFLRLRQLNADLPILLSSGYSETEIADRFGHLHVNGFLKKPYSLQSFLEILHQHLPKQA